jgi:hypothetical protein
MHSSIRKKSVKKFAYEYIFVFLSNEYFSNKYMYKVRFWFHLFKLTITSAENRIKFRHCTWVKSKIVFFSLYVVSSVIFDFLQSTSSIVNRKDISTSLTGCLRVSELRLVTVKIGYWQKILLLLISQNIFVKPDKARLSLNWLLEAPLWIKYRLG